VHPHQEERFRVVHGTVRLEVDGTKRILGPGATVSVPPGSAHTWANVGDDEACLRVEIAPALRTEMFFETLFGLARDGRAHSKGVPNLLNMAGLMREDDAELRLARPPAVVQRAVFTPLALLGRTLGYRGWYPRYTSDPMPRPR
jgi:hypothetical protein